jgi:hypothetical protein
VQDHLAVTLEHRLAARTDTVRDGEVVLPRGASRVRVRDREPREVDEVRAVLVAAHAPEDRSGARLERRAGQRPQQPHRTRARRPRVTHRFTLATGDQAVGVGERAAEVVVIVLELGPHHTRRRGGDADPSSIDALAVARGIENGDRQWNHWPAPV